MVNVLIIMSWISKQFVMGQVEPLAEATPAAPGEKRRLYSVKFIKNIFLS